MRASAEQLQLSGWIHLGVPVLLLTLGSVVLALLAWREADRARGTEQVLMKDYASFVAERFNQAVARHFADHVMGISSANSGNETPVSVLRAHLLHVHDGRQAPLPAPSLPAVKYFFLYDARSHHLEISGNAPPREEERTLENALAGLHPDCGAGQVVPFTRIGGFGKKIDTGNVEWAGLLQTHSDGSVRRVAGLRLDDDKSVEPLLVSILKLPINCDCSLSLLPASLASFSDVTHAAAFTFRNGQGRVAYRSQPVYPDAVSVSQALSTSLPLFGWTVDVAINPAVVRPMLPYGGGGTPWLALALLGTLVVGSGALAIRAFRRHAELLRLRQDFVSNVSHELKTPLTRIRLFNELLLRGMQNDSAKQSHYRQVIDRECRRLGFLVDNILDFSRQERGVRKFEPQSLNLREVVEDALESFRAASDEGRFSLSAQLQEVPLVDGDARALQQVLINLLDNAVKYSPEGSPIVVRLGANGRAVRLEICDCGRGIPESERQRIFEEFYRIDTGEAQVAAGSGLGLALVHRTIKAHGGRVLVESQHGKGSTFTVELPVP